MVLNCRDVLLLICELIKSTYKYVRHLAVYVYIIPRLHVPYM